MSLWMVRSGRHGEYEAFNLQSGYVCIGFREVPSLAGASSRDDVRAILERTFPEATTAKISNFTGQLFSFACRMSRDDLILMPLKSGPYIAVGKVTGDYEYRTDLDSLYHMRKAEWLQTDMPRTRFGQDILFSLGAAMTICEIKRHDAEARVRSMITGQTDPGPVNGTTDSDELSPEDDGVALADLERMASDQIIGKLQRDFRGHELSRLVEAVLQAEGYTTLLSPPGPDGGVDILAARGSLGFDGSRMCVQVKSSDSPADVTVLRTLQGTMTTFNAQQGLLVCWGGFKNTTRQEARQSFFTVRLWDADDFLDALMRNYDRLPEELQKELPLKRIWALVPEGE